MSEPKFTKGPWHKKGKRVFWQKPDRTLPKDNLFNGLVCICATTEDNPPEVIEEANANANLIAAAPELYRMLEKLLMAAKTANEMNPVKIHKGLLHDVEETLKEARGE